MTDDNISKYCSDLHNVDATDRVKAVNLLLKIFNNIISNPTATKYGDINLNKIRKRLDKCAPCLEILLNVGFTPSADQRRLYFKYTNNNINLLKRISATLRSGQITDEQKENEAESKVQYIDTQNMQQSARLFKKYTKTEIKRNGLQSMHLLQPEILNVDRRYLSNDSHKGHKIKKCDSFKRMSKILRYYHNKSNGMDNNHDITLILQDFHHLLDVHEHEFENVYKKFIKQCNDGEICKLSNCLMIKRNHRNRSALRMNDKQLKQMYGNSECEDVNDIIKQQTIDKIHCHYFHSFDIGYKIRDKDRIKIQQALNNDDIKELDGDDGANDRMIQEIGTYVSKKRRSFILDQNSSKFSTQIENKATVRYSFGVRYFYWAYFKNNVAINDPSRPHMVPTPANEGCTLGEFYVVAKFADLKDELINNPIYSISQVQWNHLVSNANAHLNTEYLKTKICQSNLWGNDKDSEIYYGIVGGTAISIQHVISIMVYCNQTELQRKFSETYRRIPFNESNASLISRHKNYAHLGKLLRECVDLFGSDEGNSFVESRLYHGITIQTEFKSLNACINGPTSTTTDYSVAFNFCGQSGLILELQMDTYWRIGAMQHVAAFECRYISDYSNEQEIFFIGGYSKFVFKSIINAINGKNYQHYINALSAISEFATGFNITGELWNEQQSQICCRILLDQLHKHYPLDNRYPAFKSLPLYVKSLANRHFNTIKYIQLETPETIIDVHHEGINMLWEIFKHLFFYDDGGVKFDVLNTIFPSLKTIRFKTDRDAAHSFYVNESIYLCIISLIQNNNETLLKEIVIEVPDDENLYQNINKYVVRKFGEAFKKLGWILLFMPGNSDMRAGWEYKIVMRCIESIRKETDIELISKMWEIGWITLPQIMAMFPHLTRLYLSYDTQNNSFHLKESTYSSILSVIKNHNKMKLNKIEIEIPNEEDVVELVKEKVESKFSEEFKKKGWILFLQYAYSYGRKRIVMRCMESIDTETDIALIGKMWQIEVITLNELITIFPTSEEIFLEPDGENDEFYLNESIYLSILSVIQSYSELSLKNITIYIPNQQHVIQVVKQKIGTKFTKEFEKLGWFLLLLPSRDQYKCIAMRPITDELKAEIDCKQEFFEILSEDSDDSYDALSDIENQEANNWYSDNDNDSDDAKYKEQNKGRKGNK